MATNRTRTTTRRERLNPEQEALREALAPFVDLPRLRQLAAQGEELHQALLMDEPPAEVAAMLEIVTAMLEPVQREPIHGPADLAALLMVEMGRLDREELWVASLDAKNRLQAVHTLYRGTVDSAQVRVAEVFRAALTDNCPSIIVVHNHTSGTVVPSLADIRLTCELVRAGDLLGVSVLDHLIIGQGCWTSMREQGLGWEPAEERYYQERPTPIRALLPRRERPHQLAADLQAEG